MVYSTSVFGRTTRESLPSRFHSVRQVRDGKYVYPAALCEWSERKRRAQAMMWGLRTAEEAGLRIHRRAYPRDWGKRKPAPKMVVNALLWMPKPAYRDGVPSDVSRGETQTKFGP